MSDKPLFDNTDELEVEGKDAGGDPADTATGAAALGVSAGTTGGGIGASQSTPGVGAAPAVGAAAIGETLHDEDERAGS